jgi:hypothetical protein
MGHPLNAFAIPGLLILITACFNVKPIRTGWKLPCRASGCKADTDTGALWANTNPMGRPGRNP